MPRPNATIRGPAGAGKTQEARRLLLAEATAPTVAADFQALLSWRLLLLERDPETGRYPQRLASQAAWLLPLVESLRQTVITFARDREIDLVGTNSAMAAPATAGLPAPTPWRGQSVPNG